MFFEGSEKKIEIVFNESLESLRKQPREFWDCLVGAAQARILSKIHNSHMDAYLLSESSLFVYDHRLILITCGTTRLVNSIWKVLEFYSKEDIQALFYERKNELLPQKQATHFLEDAPLLGQTFDGQALRYGQQDEHHLFLFSTNQAVDKKNDFTLEILMHEIDSSVASFFQKNSSLKGQAMRDHTALSSIIKGQVDDHFFNPSGYSLNSIDEQHYFTIHITPQTHSSYASFETNGLKKEERTSWAQKVVSLFKPKSFSLFLFNGEKIGEPHFENFVRNRSFQEKIPTGYNTQYFLFFQSDSGVQKPQKVEGFL